MNYPVEIQNLPITPFLDGICASLLKSKNRAIVLSAETAAGKSTALPVALLSHIKGKILMLEPRRLAAVAIASRVAEILGEDVGQTAGYTLHLESKKSKATRLEVVTEAILTRRLQADPLLEGISAIVIDEFHERSVHADLALAFLKETMEIRDDLFLVVMSATMNCRSVADYLGADIVEIPGRRFPVDIEYTTESVEQCVSRIANSDDHSLVYPQFDHKNVDKLWITHKNSVNSVEKSGKNARYDTILVFLPGIGEITRAKRGLEEKIGNGAEIMILHSSVPLSEQKKILSPVPADSPRRIILSSAIAETSLTVPGVTTVVDSGMCRTSRFDVALGMTRLVTERESMFSAEQRSGRAGRTMPGKAYRLWSASDARTESAQPEILRTDLSQLVLECAKWGTTDIGKLDWLTPPPESAWNAAASLLEKLGCIENGKITQKGEAVLSLGISPRLGSIALCGEGALKTVLACSEFAGAGAEKQRAFLDDIRRRIARCGFPALKNVRVPVLEGFPDRLSRRIESGADSTTYQFPSGRKAELKTTNGPEWIVATDVDAGTSTGRIRACEEIDGKDALEWISARMERDVVVDFADDGKFRMQKREISHYGEIIIKERKIPATADDFAAAVCTTVAKKGFGWLPSDEKTDDFLLRAEFVAIEDENSVLSEKIENLARDSDEWLRPFITGTSIDSRMVLDALKYHLDGSAIDRDAPREIKLPNGRTRKISYERFTEKDGRKKIRPVLEIVIQQIFGCFETPRVHGVPVLLRLLSPARRPLQITDDLGGFWNGAWLDICKEMRGRYPKHNWDYRVADGE